jgi:hypothetical protein
MIKFSNTKSPVTGADLDDVERRFAFRFPPEYREFYLHTNGGQPDPNRFTDAGGPCIVHEFLPIKYGGMGASTLEASVHLLKVERHLLPEHLVQFAVDPGGDYYCFSVRRDELGAVYLFHMDCYSNPNNAAEYLAGSLGEFLSKLKKKEEL